MPAADGKNSTRGRKVGNRVAKMQKLVVSHRLSTYVRYNHTLGDGFFWSSKVSVNEELYIKKKRQDISLQECSCIETTYPENDKYKSRSYFHFYNCKQQNIRSARVCRTHDLWTFILYVYFMRLWQGTDENTSNFPSFNMNIYIYIYMENNMLYEYTYMNQPWTLHLPETLQST